MGNFVSERRGGGDWGQTASSAHNSPLPGAAAEIVELEGRAPQHMALLTVQIWRNRRRGRKFPSSFCILRTKIKILMMRTKRKTTYIVEVSSRSTV